MTSMAAKDAKNRFGQLLDSAQRGPVSIEKHGRPVAVMISQEEFERMEVLKLESLRHEMQRGLDDVKADGSSMVRPCSKTCSTRHRVCHASSLPKQRRPILLA